MNNIDVWGETVEADSPQMFVLATVICCKLLNDTR